MNLHSTINTLTASMGGNCTPIIDQKALKQGSRPWVEEYHKRLMDGGAPDVTVPPYLRRLTVKEAALLQTFPSSFSFVGSQSSRYRQVGNAVPPKLAESVAFAVRGALD